MKTLFYVCFYLSFSFQNLRATAGDMLDLNKISKHSPTELFGVDDSLGLLALDFSHTTALIKSPGQSALNIPEVLLPLRDLIVQIAQHARDYERSYALLLVLKSEVLANKAQLFDGWHVDIDDGMRSEPQIFIVSESSTGEMGTLYLDNTLSFFSKYESSLYTPSFEELEKEIEDCVMDLVDSSSAVVKQCRERYVYELPVYSVHNAKPSRERATRTFLKLTFITQDPSEIDELREYTPPSHFTPIDVPSKLH